MTRNTSVDLNADVGEGCGQDEELIPLVSSVNISCGVHAGDAGTMRRALELALKCGAAIGAHPGFADREHFGRREIPIEPMAAAALVVGQAQALRRMAREFGARVGHVKLHGGLYNLVSRDVQLSRAVVAALAEDGRQAGGPWVLFAPTGSVLVRVGTEAGLKVLGEAFADRTYVRDGTLAPRSEPGGVIADEAEAVGQALRIARDGVARTIDGGEIPIQAETLCIHGDRPGAAALARRIRQELSAAGIAVGR